jgi:biopolymer transport protein ExbD
MRSDLFIILMIIVALPACNSNREKTFPLARLSYGSEKGSRIDLIEEKDTTPFVRFPDISKPTGKPVQHLMIFVKANNSIYSGTRELPVATLDSTLKEEMSKLRRNEFDSVTVVINADSAASYGTVYHIMRAAKKRGAKVVVRVE